MASSSAHRDDSSPPCGTVTESPRSDFHFEDVADNDISIPSASIHATLYSDSLTIRSVLLGLAIGVLICFCNIYFGLQTGWGSGMSMPAALIGFVFFRSVSAYLKLPFTPAENVLVQTVAGSAGTMSLGCGFVGIIPAIEFLLKEEEGAPIALDLPRLILWSLGISLFGSIFAVALRKEVIVRERLRFPGGTATALLIEVLHGKIEGVSKNDVRSRHSNEEEQHGLLDGRRQQSNDNSIRRHLRHSVSDDITASTLQEPLRQGNIFQNDERDKYIRYLLAAFIVSGAYTVFSYFVPQIRALPIFGHSLAINWLWALNPSPAYIGQGALMGPSTSFHMLLGVIIGWGVLSPIAKGQGWAPGLIGDWENGSKGWIMWISLSLILADSIVNMGWLILKSVMKISEKYSRHFQDLRRGGHWHDFGALHKYYTAYATTEDPDSTVQSSISRQEVMSEESAEDAPFEQQMSTTLVSILLPVAIVFCVICVYLVFGSYISPITIALATVLAVLASSMGIRALGETDLNPTSGIGKLAQLLFSIIISKTNPYAIVINLLVGSISESGAGQGGDLMQDFKTAHLIHASPKVQFYGQIIGSVFGVIFTPFVYYLYVSVYQLPSELFQMPSAYIWIFTARLVTGKGLPPKIWQFGIAGGALITATTILRIYLGSRASSHIRNLQRFVPGGIALAIGMYTTPSFSLSRAFGGLLCWLYMRHYNDSTTIVVIASGLILGEGILSMLNLGLASAGIPHF